MKPIKRVLGCVRKADEDFSLIEDGDRIAVGISGGKDSSVLLYCLNLYKRFSKKNYEICGIYIDVGFGQNDIGPVLEYFENLGIQMYNVPSNIKDILDLNLDDEGNIECYLCSRLRKGALVTKARELGCNKIALGHHNEDALETLFMNMIEGGRIATFQPNMHLSRRGLVQLRPLIYAYENDISRMCAELEIPVSKNRCPNDGYTERQKMKEMVLQLYKEYPQAKNNLQLSLRNIEQLSLLKPNKNKKEPD